MNEECLICKDPLEYLDTDEIMECELCHKKQSSKTRCISGHFVCDECHTNGMDEMISICFNSTSKNPVDILEKMMSMPSCHMHGPEHHTMVGSALLTAYKNAGGDLDLKNALYEMQKRGKQVPGGSCGFWGSCGAGVSAGMYLAIALKSTLLSEEAWGLANQMTAKALEAIGKNGGPRCCKRDSYHAVSTAVKFTDEKMGIKMETGKIICSRSHLNNQCIQERCPFHQMADKKTYVHRLVVLRGNSGSGKTTVAKGLQEKFGRNTMLISQDAVRRDILKVKDGEDTLALPLMKELLTYGSRHCDVVILEGIMYADWYKPLFELAVQLYDKKIFAYYFDIPFGETLKRHQTKPNHCEFGEEEMRRWWREKDYSNVLKECTITMEESAPDIVDHIYHAVMK